MDIWINNDPRNAEKLAAVLHEFGFPQATAGMFQEAGKIIRMGVPPIRIEVLTSISGVDFSSCYHNRTIVTFGDVPVNVIGLADLKPTRKPAAG